jgi:hypothetical protein
VVKPSIPGDLPFFISFSAERVSWGVTFCSSPIEGERSTRYFCNLEKRHYTEIIIPKLILEDNTEVTHHKDI